MLVQMGNELAGLEHFPHDIAAADEFALYIELRNGWPVGVILDALAQIGVFEHIDAFEAVSYTHLTLPTKRIV